MTVRNVNIGRKTPTPDQIGRFKDFQRLKAEVDRFEQGRQVPGATTGGGLVRKLVVTTTAAAVLIGGFGVFSLLWESDPIPGQPEIASLTPPENVEHKPVDQSANMQALLDFRAPFSHQKIDVDFTEYTVDASKGANLEYSSGTRILIPPHAFLNHIGRPLKGQVKVKYRELNGSMDLLLAGIPMQLDSAGTVQSLETAGVLEIRAFQRNGEEVYPNPDNKIRIQMASTETSPTFSLYKFSEEKGSWVYKGKDDVTVFEADEKGQIASTRKAERRKAKAQPEAESSNPDEIKRFGLRNLTNYKPALRITDRQAYKRKGSLNFTFTDLVDIQPEMKIFDKMVWHYERGIQTDDTRFFEELLSNSYKGGNYIYRYWDHVKVSYNPPRDYLSLIFVQRENSKKVTVNLLPSFAGQYKGLTCSDLYLDYLQMQDSIADAQLAILRGKRAKVNNSVYIQRSFTIGEFGLWSSERIFRYKTPQIVTVNFLNEEDQPVVYRELYCIYKEPKSVVRFGKSRKLSLDRSAGMAILVIIDDETVGYVLPEQVKNVSPMAREVTLNLITSGDVRGALVKLKEYLTDEKVTASVQP